jgi:hypothetical protein
MKSLPGPDRSIAYASNYSVFCGYTWYFEAEINPQMDRSLFSISFLLGTLIGIIGSIVILIGSKHKAIKVDKVSTVLIQHIAVLDLVTTLIVIFPTFLTAVSDRWLFGSYFCTVQAYSKWFLWASSAFFVSALNCTKLSKILFPFRASIWNARFGNLIAGSMWVFSGMILLIFHLQQGETGRRFDYLLLNCNIYTSDKVKGFIMLITGTLLCTLLVVISGIWLCVIAVKMSRKHGRSVNLQGILTVIFVAGVYCASYLPLVGCYFTKLIGKNYYHGYLRIVSKCIGYINNIANVFVYMLSLTSFRNFVKKIFATIFGSIRSARNSISSKVKDQSNGQDVQAARMSARTANIEMRPIKLTVLQQIRR